MKFIYFLFLSLMLLVLHLRNHCPFQGHEDLVSNSFIVLTLTLKKKHLWPIWDFFLICCGRIQLPPSAPAPLKRVFFPPLNCLGAIVENPLFIWDLFLPSQFCPIDLYVHPTIIIPLYVYRSITVALYQVLKSGSTSLPT